MTDWSDIPCKLWTGYKAGKGYGAYMSRGKQVLVHRDACQKYYGYSDLEMESRLVCHKCDVKTCYEPTHLYLGDNESNQKDSLMAGTHNWVRLDTGDVEAIKSEKGTQAKIAKMYGVSQSTVSRIKAGKRWGWL